MTALRIVSVIAPCRNERAHIEAFAASALAQQLPAGWQLEVIVADGGSDDGTLEVLARAAAADARLRIAANPARIVSTGLNRAIAEASGEVIVRMDVHTTYAPDYVAECLAALERSGADNVGGPWHAEVDANGGAMQEAVVATFQSPLIAGGALSRRLDYEGPADTVYLGAWPRATFARFGTFDETLVRNQDDEHNLRIVRAGGRVWQSARIRSAYRPRAHLGQVFRQYLQYGYWKPFVMKKHGRSARLRHLVPGAFICALALCAIGAFIGWGAWPLAALVAAYATTVIAMSLAVLIVAPQRLAVAVRIPSVILAYHLAYGIGSVVGAFDALRSRGGGARFAGLTR